MKKRFLSLMLIVAMALGMVACSGSNQNKVTSGENGQEGNVVNTETIVNAEAGTNESGNVLGEGTTVFMLSVVDKDGNESVFEIHTDKSMVGDALMDVNLIESESGDYGLFVKKVNGITADYDVDKTYWAFYINGEYAMSGVDTTPITEGEIYSFKVEK